MSNTNKSINGLKREVLSLYREILKAHYKYLPNTDMRVFGDYFVKSEFTLHYHNSKELSQLISFKNM